MIRWYACTRLALQLSENVMPYQWYLSKYTKWSVYFMKRRDTISTSNAQMVVYSNTIAVAAVEG